MMAWGLRISSENKRRVRALPKLVLNGVAARGDVQAFDSIRLNEPSPTLEGANQSMTAFRVRSAIAT